MSRKLWWSAVAAVLMVAVLVLWRGFYLRHAVIVGLGAAALVYSIQRATENLKQIHRPQGRPPTDP